MTSIRPLASPYDAPDFYRTALDQGRHRAIVGGRWEETGRLQMAALIAEGLTPSDRLLDIGAGAMRLGCRAVPWLEPGRYWATDRSRALMLRGREAELADPARLSPGHLVEDAGFAFDGVPDDIDMAIAFAVFTHLPEEALATALMRVGRRFDGLRALLLTVFLVPEGVTGPWRQADGVVTHPDRPPRHMTQARLETLARCAGLTVERRATMLPRGQVLFVARRTGEAAPAS